MAVLPGLAGCVALAAAALALAELPAIKGTLHLSALLLVILLGMAWKSIVHVPEALLPGIRMAQRPVLRWAVAGLGFRLSIGELFRIGAPALAVVTISTFAALGFGWWVARRLAVGEKLGLLLGVGGAICGASAVVAADSVVQGEKRDSALALGVITLLGTIGIALYPVLHHALRMSDFLYGVWDGASLHEMAQVVAAGFGVSDEAARVATVVKLARICLLAPVVLYIGWSLRHRHRAAGRARVAPLPWFLVLFVGFALLNSTGWLRPAWIEGARRVDLWLLCVGMAGVGLQTGFSELRDAGFRPIAAGTAQWVFLSSVSYALARWLCR
ncbi:MAG: putative sulfate exporter family transporter [Candidatus Eisenbacteria bacterium]|uniref:Putative sulfate exporter family transporter n=1 Tax=Eiseniibacteriota bacterium TaxID=2212470 RepID=A0A538SKZ6_UNCEI|nr:MAG: putative sulfate exporter family transporter [Candidatus Eisenbacteria bacterium]